MVWESSFRGHTIYYDEDVQEWYFIENGVEITVEEKDHHGKACSCCGNLPIPFESKTGNGIDFCIGFIPGVKAACCGHGDPDYAYVSFIDSEKPSLQKQEALDFLEPYRIKNLT